MSDRCLTASELVEPTAVVPAMKDTCGSAVPAPGPDERSADACVPGVAGAEAGARLASASGATELSRSQSLPRLDQDARKGNLEPTGFFRRFRSQHEREKSVEPARAHRRLSVSEKQTRRDLPGVVEKKDVKHSPRTELEMVAEIVRLRKVIEGSSVVELAGAIVLASLTGSAFFHRKGR